MSTARTHTYTSTHSTLTLDDGSELELPIAGEIMEHLLTIREDGTIRVSYMLANEDAQALNPAEQDCWGWEMVLLDSQRDADDLSERLGRCEHCGVDAGWPCEVEDDPHERVNADRAATEAGRAFLIEKYEHGLVRYVLQGESSMVDRRWDVTNVAGWIKADDDWGEDVDLRESARAALAEYTDWCNGSIYGIVHVEYRPVVNAARRMTYDEFEQVSHDACWGYIGYEYAERMMKEGHGA